MTAFQEHKAKFDLMIAEDYCFMDICQYIEEVDSSILDDKNLYHFCADRFAKKHRMKESLECFESLVSRWPDGSAASQRILSGLANGYVDLNGCRFKLDSPSLSDAMKIIIARGQYETTELDMLRRYSVPEDRIIELGSGIGFVGINYCKENPNGTYVGYEANPHLVELTKENQQLNDVCFDVHNAILDQGRGEINFYVTDDFWASSLIEPPEYVEKLKVDILDINEAIRKDNINFLTMDIEGAELELLPKVDLGPIDKVILEIHQNVFGIEGAKKIIAHLQENGFVLPPGKWGGSVFMLYKKARVKLPTT